MRTDPLWLGGRGATVPQCPGFRAHFRRPLRLAGRRFLIGPEHTTGTSPFHRHYLPPSALFDLLVGKSRMVEDHRRMYRYALPSGGTVSRRRGVAGVWLGPPAFPKPPPD